MCELTLQMILLCNCSLSLNVFIKGLQCNLQFLSTTVLQGSVATWVNDGGIFNDFFMHVGKYFSCLLGNAVPNDDIIVTYRLTAAIRQWRRRLSACVQAGGGHFEHHF